MHRAATAEIRIDGRRLRPIRLSPVTAAIALALLVVGFVLRVVAMMFGLAALGTFAGLAMLSALFVTLPYAWSRLTAKGRILLGAPVVCTAAACVFVAFDLPGATVLGLVAFGAFVVAV